ncbi:DUF262 domain-containing protein [Campylobacter sp. MOP7]|uniref:DUF262 domain-containing protein n=1 Tax=Campylobacter canis TaxID=3378588 RepID=UPI00387EBBC6
MNIRDYIVDSKDIKADGTRETFDIFEKNSVIVNKNFLVDIFNLMEYGKIPEEAELITPFYQRELVWTLEQKQDLIRSILYNIPIGGFVFVMRAYDKDSWQKLDKVTWNILDGKQRYNAIIEFLENKFDVDGKFFKDLKPMDRKMFLKFSSFTSLEFVDIPFEMELDFYKKLNFGGTAHTKEDLERINKNLIKE